MEAGDRRNIEGSARRTATHVRLRRSLLSIKLAFFRAVMPGDSLTEGIDWRELFPDVKILNRGISGDTSAGVLNRLDEVIGRHPKIVGSHDWSQRPPDGCAGPAGSREYQINRPDPRRQRIRVALQQTLYVTSGYWPQIKSTAPCSSGSIVAASRGDHVRRCVRRILS